MYASNDGSGESAHLQMADSPESSLLDNVIGTKITFSGPNVLQVVSLFAK